MIKSVWMLRKTRSLAVKLALKLLWKTRDAERDVFDKVSDEIDVRDYFDETYVALENEYINAEYNLAQIETAIEDLEFTEY